MTQTICKDSCVVSLQLSSFYSQTYWIVSEAHYHYKKEDIVLLTDDSTNPRMMPTRQNMVRC